MGMRTVVLWLCAVSLRAEYLNLVATADGRTVYFQMSASPGTTAWYAIRVTEGGLVTERVEGQVADSSDSGELVGYSSAVNRFCGIVGSTCFVQPGCYALWRLLGPGVDVGNDRWRTFLRMDRAGELVWMEQDLICGSRTVAPPPALKGLFETATMRRVAAAEWQRLASRRHGRRLITNTGKALVFSDQQLHWLSRDGTVPIRHVNGAFEAVTDAWGENVVYVEGEEVGELHWLAGGGDFRLGLVGSAPALTADGSALFFLDAEGALTQYDAVTRTAARVGSDVYRVFTLATGFVFAITRGGRIVRVDPANEEAVEWQEAMPELESFEEEMPFSFYCPLFCYSETQERALWLMGGDRVRVFGRNLNQSGWRLRGAGFDVPLEVVSDEEAFFDVPPASGSLTELTLYHPERAVRYQVPARWRR